MATPAPSVSQKLIVVGGGGRPAQAVARFIDWAGRTQARLLVVTWAAPSAATVDFYEALRDDFSPFNPHETVHAIEASEMAVRRGEFLGQLARATGVFFSGGDQNRVMDLLEQDALRFPGTQSVVHALREKYARGTVFGGTSAGTAIMSSPMFTGQGDDSVFDGAQVGFRNGLGLIAGVVFDQHFLANRRTLRLMGFVSIHPGKLGLGIDEDTALIIENSRFAQVVGTSKVLAMELNPTTQKIETLPLSAGQKYDLLKRAVY